MTELLNGVPKAAVAHLNAAGWYFHPDVSSWRKHNDQGVPFSPHAADHDRIFPEALATALSAADVIDEAKKAPPRPEPDNQSSAQNNDTTQQP